MATQVLRTHCQGAEDQQQRKPKTNKEQMSKWRKIIEHKIERIIHKGEMEIQPRQQPTNSQNLRCEGIPTAEGEGEEKERRGREPQPTSATEREGEKEEKRGWETQQAVLEQMREKKRE